MKIYGMSVRSCLEMRMAHYPNNPSLVDEAGSKVDLAVRHWAPKKNPLKDQNPLARRK